MMLSSYSYSVSRSSGLSECEVESESAPVMDIDGRGGKGIRVVVVSDVGVEDGRAAAGAGG